MTKWEQFYEVTKQEQFYEVTKQELFYEVAGQEGLEKNIVRIEWKNKEVKLGRRVLQDAEDPHLPTPVLGVYWMAASATNRLLVM